MESTRGREQKGKSDATERCMRKEREMGEMMKRRKVR